MCIGIFAFNHPGYALILASNRDEYLARATAPTSFHSFHVDGIDKEYVLSGVDLQAGGSWLGINKHGEIAMLTNITSPDIAQGVLSRGDLVKNFLTRSQSQDMSSFVDRYTHSDAKYGGFNLLLLSPSRPSFGGGNDPDPPRTTYKRAMLTNNNAKGQIISVPNHDDETVGAVSNAPGLGSGLSDWPKVREGKCRISSLLQDKEVHDEDTLTVKLLEMMRWKATHRPRTRSELPETIQVQPFDNGGGIYGTRLSTILLVRNDGSVRWVEKDIFKLHDGKAVEGTETREFSFKIVS